jgi:hypothetical protein
MIVKICSTLWASQRPSWKHIALAYQVCDACTQSMDEVQNIQTSHDNNSSIQCLIHMCNIIMESHFRALQLLSNDHMKKVNSKSQHSKWTHSIRLLKLKQGPPCCRPLKEHSKNLKHILMGVMLHAQSIDEVLNVQTSSIHTSFIKCPNEEYQSILESHFRAL